MAFRSFTAAALAAALLATSAHAATLPPHLRFHTLETAQARVHYHQGLEETARRAAALCDEVLVSFEERYGFAVPPVDLVLVDADDEPNGFATPLPYPLVQIRVVSPDGSDDLGNQEDWLRLVITHELAHVVHLERARGLPGFGRKVFGRAPILFPNALSPDWLVEGLATHEETRLTSFGRGRTPDARMVLRMAALEGRLPREDEAVNGYDRWPAGQSAYLFGAAYMQWLEEQFGDDTMGRLAGVHGGRVVPFLDDLTARRVTGGTHRLRWRQWQEELTALSVAEAANRRELGLTPSTALTTRGVRQVSPRFSPDGARIAYTSRELTRPRSIRVMNADGTGDRVLVERHSGTNLSWTPDGGAIVFDRLEVLSTFQERWDLFRVDVASGRVSRLTRGLRARDPDVSPDGTTVVFVRQHAQGSELQLMPLGGGPARHLAGVSGEQWSDPRFSPDGTMVAAGRWRNEGELDVVLVDVATGDVTALTDDRARDVEPTWTPDGTHVVFRSDRDGISNVHAVSLDEGVLLRLTNVIGGAFTPEVSRDGHTLAFASYSASGYDIHVTPLDLPGALPALTFADPYPPPRPGPAPVESDPRPYSAWRRALPRFWLPVLEDGAELRVGVATAGADPLRRHLYGATVHRGHDTKRVGGLLYYVYDRHRPTFTAVLDQHFADSIAGAVREREVVLQAAMPLRRRVRHTQSLAVSWRRSREEIVGNPVERVDLGGVELGWRLDTITQEPFSISPTDGWRLRLSGLREDPTFGSQIATWKVVGDLRRYQRVGGNGVLALRLGGGDTLGEPAFVSSYAVGGFADGNLLDVVRTNHSVLRGYDEDIASGRRFAHANAELRVPLLHPQRGWRLLPFFLRHVHGAVFVDSAHAWTGDLDLADVRTAVGAVLGMDVVVGHNLPLTITGGVGQGLRAGAQPLFYFRAGLAF